MLAIAARQWWVLVLQGVLGIIVGILAIMSPDLALATIALLFAAWAIVSGASQLAAGWRVAETRGRSWPFLLAGAVSVVAGVLAVLNPDITILYLILLLGAWILFSGAMEVYTAWRIRDEVTGEWILALAGILRIVVGVIILGMPIVGAVLTAALFATWAILSGVGALLLGFRLRQFGGRMAAGGMA
jgi:uncharacterized membrane protein HdeD (DUF308 family)